MAQGFLSGFVAFQSMPWVGEGFPVPHGRSSEQGPASREAESPTDLVVTTSR